MKRAMLMIVATAVVLAISVPADATIIEVPLDCAGGYSLSDTWTGAFDAGVSFTEVAAVYIAWSGEMEGAETMNAGVIDTQFVASLYESQPEDYFGRAYTQGGADTYPNPWQFEVVTPFSDGSWNAVLDGKANIHLWYGETTHVLGDPILSTPTGTIFSASLLIDGTPVPEPTTLFFLVMGIVWFAKGGASRR